MIVEKRAWTREVQWEYKEQDRYKRFWNTGNKLDADWLQWTRVREEPSLFKDSSLEDWEDGKRKKGQWEEGDHLGERTSRREVGRGGSEAVAKKALSC